MGNHQSIEQSLLCKICIKSNIELYNNDNNMYKTVISVLYFINTFPERKDFGFRHLVSGTARNIKRQQRTF